MSKPQNKQYVQLKKLEKETVKPTNTLSSLDRSVYF